MLFNTADAEYQWLQIIVKQVTLDMQVLPPHGTRQHPPPRDNAPRDKSYEMVHWYDTFSALSLIKTALASWNFPAKIMLPSIKYTHARQLHDLPSKK